MRPEDLPVPEDYQPEARSGRHRLADHLAEELAKLGLHETGNEVAERSDDGRSYQISVQSPEMGGMVRVFSPEYITVWWRTIQSDLPTEGRRVYASQEECLAFLRLAFVKQDAVKAMAVPVRTPKPKKAKAQKQSEPTNLPAQMRDPQAHVPESFPEDYFG